MSAILLMFPGRAHSESGATRNPGTGEKLISAGRRLFESRCAACHALDENRTGPRLRGVLGRTAGSMDDYRYSRALANSRIVWDEAALNCWLSGPARFVPGVKMQARFDNPVEREAIISYLRAAAADSGQSDERAQSGLAVACAGLAE